MPGSSKWSPSFSSPHQNPVCTSAAPPMCHVPLYLVLFYFITQIINGMKYISQSCSLCSLLRSPVTSSFLAHKIFLSILFPYTLSLCSFLNLKLQVSHQYKRTGKIAVLYRLNFDYTFITNLMHWLLFIRKILLSSTYSSIKCSSSGGHSCIQATYGTVTLYKSSWWPVDTQLEWELNGGGRLLVGRLKTPYQQPSPSSQFSL